MKTKQFSDCGNLSGVYLRRCYRAREGKRHAYWALVKSVRTARGPRQQVVAYLGEMDAAGRLGMADAAAGGGEPAQGKLFEPPPTRRWVEVDHQRVRLENGRSFGGYWLGVQLADRLGLIGELSRLMEPGREKVPWPMMALVLVLCRLCEPSSELHIAEHAYEQSALGELLGIPASVVNDARLYRALDALLPHKEALQKHLKNRLGELFDLKYDLLLYDVTARLSARRSPAPILKGNVNPIRWLGGATRAISVLIASRFASRWTSASSVEPWSAARGCRSVMNCSPATRRM